MRAILFRAKVIHNHFEKPDGTYRLPQGSWVYGCLIKDCNERPMIDIQGYVDGSGVHYQYYVDPETVGQFTGLHDKNGNEIYEGDIAIVRVSDERFKANPRFDKSAVYYNNDRGRFEVKRFDCFRSKRLEIIGNVHDNPELLKGGGK